MHLMQLKENQERLAVEMRSIVDAAKKVGRGLTPEERTQWSNMVSAFEETETSIEAEEMLSRMEEALATMDLSRAADQDVAKAIADFEEGDNSAELLSRIEKALATKDAALSRAADQDVAKAIANFEENDTFFNFSEEMLSRSMKCSSRYDR